MKTIRFRLLVAALAVLMGTAIAKSQTAADAPPSPPPGRGEFGAFHMIGFFAKNLDLTEDQKTQMKTILEKERPAMKPLMQQSHQIEQQLHQYAEGTYNETKVRALATQQSKVELELSVQRTRIHNELFLVLTPDQQAKLKELEANHEARMQQHMQDAPPAPPAEQ
jgi:Spy/CpxP family protein refolding chaperone